MRIAILTWDYPPKKAGGTEIATQEIARRLSQKGHDVRVITTRDKGLPTVSHDDALMIHRTNNEKFKPLRYYVLCLKALIIIKRFNPDIIQAQALWMGPIALLAKLLFKKPYVIWLRGSDIYYPRFFKGPLSSIVINNADSVIALNNDMKQEIEKLTKRKDIRILGNGVNYTLFQNTNLSAEPNRVLIFVGSLVPNKGVVYLIKAVCILKEDYPEVKLIIVGDGPERQSLEKLALELNLQNNITFTGRVSNLDVPTYLSQASIFILPSLSEGFPNAIAEAMAAGLPVICTRVGGLQEIVKDAENGYTVPPRNPSELADRIKTLFENAALYNAISLNNRSWARKNSWENIIESLEKLYGI